MAAQSLKNFTASLRERNVSRPNQYYVEILTPNGLMGEDEDTARLVSMWCHTAQTPQLNILTNDRHIEAGVNRKYAYDQQYSNLSLSFYIDQDYKTKKFFDDWKNLIVPQKRNFGFPSDYTAESINVYIINQANKETYKYEFSRVFPVSVNAVELSYTPSTTASTFTVDFVFEEVFFSSIENGQETSTTKPLGLIKPTNPNEEILMNQEVMMIQVGVTVI